MLSLANGGLGCKKAFAAFVHFRDKDGGLVLPPYQGFSHSSRGMAYFYVAGGENRRPIATIRSFTPPLGATTMQIELRPWACRERPRLAVEPRLIDEDGTVGAPAFRPSIHILSISENTRGVMLSLANGHRGADKAFVVAVRFLDKGGTLIPPPYEGFAKSDRFAAYFYAKGGKADAPSVVTHRFAPPIGAAAMELELHPWRVKETSLLASAPALVSDVPGEPSRRRTAPMPRPTMAPGYSFDSLSNHLAAPPMGSQIAERVEAGRIRIVGIFGESLREAWGGRVADAALSFDGYDRDWDRTDPSHLVIEVAHLPRVFGWENALTLHDPAATVEMAVMLEMARAAGIRTVLIQPDEPYRYPLLSRIAHLFDVALKPGEATSTMLALAPLSRT